MYRKMHHFKKSITSKVKSWKHQKHTRTGIREKIMTTFLFKKRTLQILGLISQSQFVSTSTRYQTLMRLQIFSYIVNFYK